MAKMPRVKDALTVDKNQGSADDWRSFKPMYFMATYKDSATKTEHVIIVIIAPFGMYHDDLLKCHLQVKEDGKKLIFSSQWLGLFHKHGSIASQAGEHAWQVCPRH